MPPLPPFFPADDLGDRPATIISEHEEDMGSDDGFEVTQRLGMAPVSETLETGAGGDQEESKREFASDEASYGFASVTSSITRETLGDHTNNYSTNTVGPTTFVQDEEDTPVRGLQTDVEGGYVPPPESAIEEGSGSNGKTSGAVVSRGDTSHGSSQSPETGLCYRANKRNLFLIFAFILILVGALTAMGVIINRNNDDSDDEDNPNEVSRPVEPPPTTTPTASPTDARIVEINSVIADVSGNVAFTPGTPQYDARLWLLEEDELALELSEGTTEDRIIQRYSLVTIYFALAAATEAGNTRGRRHLLGEDSNAWLNGEECGTPGDGTDNIWHGLNCNENGEVRAIAFDNVGLNGTIPPEIGELTLLENLIIKNEKGLHGQIPETIGNLTLLGQIGLYNDSLTGSIPLGLYNLTNLRYINFQDNDMTGHVTLNIVELTKLEKLIVNNNRFSGPVHYHHLAASLKYLGLTNNSFTGSIAHQISLITDLEYLYLDGNQLDGELPETLGNLVNLKSINLDNNNIEGPLPTNIGNLVNVVYFSIYNNSLTGNLPAEIGNMSSLETLNLASNQLGGPIPGEIGMLDSLVALYLFFNQFNSTIPETVGDMDSLEVLFLSSNELTGPIPTNITGLNDTLTGLYLSANQLNGSIPFEFCELTMLEALFLDENEFTGEVPACIGNLTALQRLYMFNNSLAGNIPADIERLLNLQELGLEDNNFTGSVDDGICALTTDPLYDFWADCNIECECCSVCCPSPECV